MKIGIDASRYNVKTGTGVELYSVKLIQGIIDHFKHDKSHEVILYSPRKLMLYKANNIVHRIMPFKRLWTKVRFSWEMLQNKPDVLFVPSHVLPYFGPKRQIITVHDVAFMHLRSSYSWFQYWYLKRETKRAVQKASTIIVPSEATKKDLKHFFGCKDSKIKVIYHGIDTKIVKLDLKVEEEVLEKMHLKRSDNFMLFIGRLEAKKNIVRLVKAFLKFREKNTNWKLILAGNRGDGFNKILKEAMKIDALKHVLMPGYITDNEKHVLLKHCNAFVFPSLYEGFGFPILEAYAYGKPVVTSDTASIPEVAGEGCIYVNPNTIESIKEGMERLVLGGVPDLNAQRAQLEKFKWSECIDTTIAVLLST